MEVRKNLTHIIFKSRNRAVVLKLCIVRKQLLKL